MSDAARMTRLLLLLTVLFDPLAGFLAQRAASLLYLLDGLDKGVRAEWRLDKDLIFMG